MRSKKAALNIITKFISQFVSLVCGLIVPRLILASFGSTYNGAISSIGQIFGVISILTAGLAGATRVELYKTLASEDVDGTSRIIKATELFMHRVGVIILGYTVIISIIYPLFFRGQIAWIEVVLLVVIIASSTFAQNNFGYTYKILLQASQSEYIDTVIYTVLHILNTVVIVIVIKLGSNIFIVKAASAVLFVFYPIFLRYYVRHKFRLRSDCEADMTAIKNRSAVMFHSVANVVHNQTDTLVLTVFTNAMTVSVYSIYYIVLSNVKQMMQNFVTGIEAAFGSMWAKGENELFKKNFDTYEFLMYSFSSVIFSCVGLLLVPFIALYTAGVHDINYIRPGFAIMATITEAVFCIRQPYVTIVQAAGKYKETRNGAIYESIINLVLSIALVYFYGLIGVIIGTLVANLFRTIQYALYSSKNLIHRNIGEFVKKCLWHVLNSALIIIIFEVTIKNIPMETWKGWIIAGIATFSLSLAITVLSSALFYRSELKHSIQIVKRMIRR